MLFLFNDQILMIGGGPDVAIKAGIPTHAVARFTLADTILAIQTAFMEIPNLPTGAPEKAKALAWLLASRSNANAALFLVPPKCKYPQEVGFRLATVSLVTLGNLKNQQDGGKLSANIVNACVWQAQAA